MKTFPLSTALLIAVTSLFAQSASEQIDFSKARQLHERRQRGETLSEAEQDYLQRAIAERRKQSGTAISANQRKASDRLIPLTDMSAADRYEGEDGGLYGQAHNGPPEAHQKAARAALAMVRPLNSDGEPDEHGVIGFVAISMSNATQEFSRFKEIADRSPLKNRRVVIVDCAQGGQAMAEWAPPDARPWQEALRRLKAAGVSPKQVQTAWVKLANKMPTGPFQTHAHELESNTLAVLHNAKRLFPNLQIAYLGSRIYAGYAKTPLNPEPYAYESAFAARWLIERQMKGEAELALTKCPLLLWGPYLWADGTKGRKIDQLMWNREDVGPDGVHPSQSGRQKVAELLLNFLTTDPLAKGWFSSNLAIR